MTSAIKTKHLVVNLFLWLLCNSFMFDVFSTIQPRFIVILLVGLFHVVCSLSLVLGQNMMAFRVGGALESLQVQYNMLNLCFSLLTFDLQAQVRSL